MTAKVNAITTKNTPLSDALHYIDMPKYYNRTRFVHMENYTASQPIINKQIWIKAVNFEE